MTRAAKTIGQTPASLLAQPNDTINPGNQQSTQGLPAIPHFIAEKRGKYRAIKPLTESQIVKAAVALMGKKIDRGDALSSPDISQAFLHWRLRGLEYEVFVCLFLDNQNRVLKLEQLFRGTIDAASVYPREVAKRALQLNAAAVILAHNHPSGMAEPIIADKHITERLKHGLGLLDIRVLDHIIVGDGCFSFAEHGLI
jgi:DNA repair protein RadC